MLFSFGVPDLDKLYGEALEEKTTIVIAGHPGSGKTTLASIICFKNAVNGNRCLYIGLQEDRDKVYGRMRKLGVDLERAEEKGIYKFIKLPITRSITDLAEWIIRLVSEYKPKILVIDPVTAVLEVIDEKSQRGWLQNFFYELSSTVKGLTVLVAETPPWSKGIEPSKIEFIADVVIVLKHRVERGLVVRTLELKKARSSALLLAEIPFTLVEGRGLQVYLPPIIPDIPAELEELSLPCKSLAESVPGLKGGLGRGRVVYVSYPPEARGIEPLILALFLAIANNTKVHYISYRVSPSSMREDIKRNLCKLGVDGDVAEEVLEEYAAFHSTNPFARTAPELYVGLARLVEREDTGIIVIHAADLYALALGEDFVPTYYNTVNYAKKLGKSLIAVASRIDARIHRVLSRLADVVMNVRVVRRLAWSYARTVYVWVRGEEPREIPTDVFNACFAEAVGMIKQLKSAT